MTESAIPEHLTVARTRAARTPEGYDPPSPAFVARPPETQRQVVMAYLGAQGETRPPSSRRRRSPARTPRATGTTRS